MWWNHVPLIGPNLLLLTASLSWLLGLCDTAILQISTMTVHIFSPSHLIQQGHAWRPKRPSASGALGVSRYSCSTSGYYVMGFLETWHVSINGKFKQVYAHLLGLWPSPSIVTAFSSREFDHDPVFWLEYYNSSWDGRVTLKVAQWWPSLLDTRNFYICRGANLFRI